MLLTPSRRRASPYPIASHTSANTKGLETLWIENAVSTSPISNDLPRAPTTEIPNQSGEALREDGDVVGHRAVARSCGSARRPR